MENSTEDFAEETQDVKIRTLHQKVTVLKHSRELEGAYMTMEEMLKDREAEGKAEGSQLILELVSLMSADGLTKDISRLKADEIFCRTMLEKYHLT